MEVFWKYFLSQQHLSQFFPFSEESNVLILFQTLRLVLVNSDASNMLMCSMRRLQLINVELAGMSD